MNEYYLLCDDIMKKKGNIKTKYKKCIQILSKDRFVYDKNTKEIYFYNNNKWIQDNNIFKSFLESELSIYLSKLVLNKYDNEEDKRYIISKYNLLNTILMKNSITYSYKYFCTISPIDFNNKWWLFGFNNILYDLNKHEYREYKNKDYVINTTSYDWIEPSINEIEELHNILNKLFINIEIKKSFFTIISLFLEGKATNKILFASNINKYKKKILINFLLAAFGEYSHIYINQMDYIRWDNYIERRFNIISQHSSNIEHILKNIINKGSLLINCTSPVIIENNYKDIYYTNIIDIPFQNNECNNQYNNETYDYIKYRCAMIHILFTYYKEYKKEQYKFICNNIFNCLNTVLINENIINWFNFTYIKTNDINDKILIRDIYNNFINSNNFKILKNTFINYKFLKLYVQSIFINDLFFTNLIDNISSDKLSSIIYKYKKKIDK